MAALCGRALRLKDAVARRDTKEQVPLVVPDVHSHAPAPHLKPQIRGFLTTSWIGMSLRCKINIQFNTKSTKAPNDSQRLRTNPRLICSATTLLCAA